MAKKSNTTTWLVLIAAAAVVALIATQASAGVLAVSIVAGLMAGIKTPASGTVVLQLPAGASWLSGQASTETLTPQALQVPVPASGAWSLQVTPNMSVSVQWQDSSGTQQQTFLTFS